MNKCIFIFLITVVISCGPEGVDPCSLDHLDKTEYRGFVSLCNAIPGSQQDFGAKAFLTVADTIITILIQDTISNVNYEKTAILRTECYEGEPGYINHDLYVLPANQYIGKLHTSETFLIMYYEQIPCENSLHFEGVKN